MRCPTTEPFKILLVTAHPLWAQVCREILEVMPRKIKVLTLIACDYPNDDIYDALAITPSLTLVSLDSPSANLSIIRSLSMAGNCGPVLVLCSCYMLPDLEDLIEVGVRGVVSSLASLDELEASILAFIDGRPESLLQQYLRAARTPSYQPLHQGLNEREKEIMQLVADDLTDQEIALNLDLSVRTVNNHLHYIYAKLGVRGRAGAVAIAIVRGIISLHYHGAHP